MIINIVSIVKNNRIVFFFYYYLVSTILRFIRLFIKTDKKLILFVSYGGRYFNDSPRCIYEAMLKDERYKDYKLVWAFLNPDSIEIKTPKVNITSFRYFITALKASCWVTNAVIERGLNFRGKNTFYLHTTHTTLPKLMGHDDKESGSFTLPCEFKYDCSCAQSEKEKQMQKSMFHLRDEQIIVSGLPKNDILCNYSEQARNDIRNRLGIPADKKAILYAPTYRDVKFGAMRCPVDFKHWESLLGKDFIVLFRAHPVVANETKIDSSTGFVFDVSSYPDNMELMIASDILISDYSGMFFEYGVQDKPMYCFAYDYDEYIKVRSLYFDIRDMIPGGHLVEEDLLETIKEGISKGDSALLKKFKEDYVAVYGNATEICLDVIYKNIAK